MASSTGSRRPPRPTARDIEAAARRLKGWAVETPLLESPALDALIGGRLLIKAECLQLTGSFKFRGAFNRISRLTAAERRGGVVAHSSGNHAQGVAAAARLLGIPAVIVMPRDAPAVKVEGTRFWGAEIVFYDRARENREAISRRIAEERSAVLVPPYDDPLVIAGQGTVGREIARAAAARGLRPEALIVPCGGGGLVAGSAIAFKAAFPRAEVYAAEPKGWDDTRRSLAAGRRVGPARKAFPTLCDALLAPLPGALTFPINRRLLTGALVADDSAVLRAMALAFRQLKIVLEPGGAMALAAVLGGAFDARGKTVAVVASGGNVEPALFRKALALSNGDSAGGR